MDVKRKFLIYDVPNKKEKQALERDYVAVKGIKVKREGEEYTMYTVYMMFSI